MNNTKHEEKKRPLIGTGVIIIKDGKVFLRRRKNVHGGGTWGFTGGHLEFGESLEENAKRETKEEAGIDIGNIRLGPVTEDIFKKEGKHYVTVFMVADHKKGKAKNCEPEKCDEIGWFSWENMPRPLFLPIENLLKQGFDPFEKK